MSKIAFLDIDGTIRAFDGTVPESAVNAIQKARANGHQVCISSGRPVEEIEKRIIDIGFDGIISASGSYVIYGGKCIRHVYFPQELYLDIAETMLKNDCVIEMQCHDKSCIVESQTEDFVKLGEELQALLGNSAAKLAQIPGVVSKAGDMEQVEKILYFSDTFSNDDVKRLWEDLLYVVPLSFPNPRKFGGELSMATANKAEGIKSILEVSGHCVQDVVAVGDSENDVEMIRLAALGIAMGNATDGAKAAADAVTDTLENDGLYKAFEMAGML